MDRIILPEGISVRCKLDGKSLPSIKEAKRYVRSHFRGRVYHRHAKRYLMVNEEERRTFFSMLTQLFNRRQEEKEAAKKVVSMVNKV